MGISINVSTKNDYSYLFSSLNTNSNTLNTSFLTDYAAIKSGSYGKLMKAYYAQNTSDEVNSLMNSKSTSVSQDSSVTLANVESRSKTLNSTLSDLAASGEDSLYADTNREDLEKKVGEFVNGYNSLLSAGEGAFATSISSKMQVVENTVASSTKELAKIGISVNADKTLSVNKDMLTSASKEEIQAVFQKNNSMGDKLSSQVESIGSSAKTESSKANTYTGSGAYGNTYNSGRIFSSWT